MNPKPELSVVIPVFNEARSLLELEERCLAACRRSGKAFEIILVDDGSFDGSDGLIGMAARRNPGLVKGVFLNRNYGQHAAILAGFAESRGGIVVTLDADLQNPPEEIPSLVACMEEGYDVVGTVRQNRQDSLFRKAASRLINSAVQRVTGARMSDYGCMLRAYRRHVVDAVLRCREHGTFIPVLANSFAGATAEIPVAHSRRAEGASKYGLLKLFALQLDLVACMTTFPLRLLTALGLGIASFGVGFGGYLMIMRMLHGSAWAADGVFTLFAVLFIFVGAQFMALGLIGEYIGRIYNDVRQRPRYFVKRVTGPDNARNFPTITDARRIRSTA